MESRWYLPPGQNLANTKIADRGHALHATSKAWEKITAHLDRKRLQAETFEKEKAHAEALKQGSQSMTQQWDNSVENIRKRKEEERTKRIQKEEETKMQNFLQLRKEQAAIRDKYIQDVRKTMYISKGPPKNLTGALVFSEVLYERERQIEFAAMLEEQRREEERQYAAKVKQGVLDENQEKFEKEEKVLKKKLELRELYLNNINDKVEEEKKEKEEKIAGEIIDNINIVKEIDILAKFRKEEDKQKRDDIKEEVRKFKEQQENLKKNLAIEDKEQDAVITIYSQAKHRIECLRKQRDKDLQAEMALRRTAASKQAVAALAAKSSDEERRLQQAIAERDQKEEEKRLARAEYDKQLRLDRDEDRRQFMEREKQRLHEEAELKKWEMLNRCKKEEFTRKYEQEKLEKNWKGVLQHRKDLFEQMDEKQEELKKEREEDDWNANNIVETWKKVDDQFMEYAGEVMDYAKAGNRSTYAINRVIYDYKKENGLPLPPPAKRCVHYDSYECRKAQGIVNSTPGKMCHLPKTDPIYTRCRCKKEALYK